MKIETGTLAKDFTATALDGQVFHLSDYKGSKILLSFFRNGACALCNLRVHEMIKRNDEFRKTGIKIIAVFESSIEDMTSFVGAQQPPFILLSDPQAKLYDIYGVETSEEKISQVMKNNVAHERIAEAAQNGFQLTPQANSNFFRLPADFLIDENFVIQKAHYSNQVIDHLTFEEIFRMENVE